MKKSALSIVLLCLAACSAKQKCDVQEKFVTTITPVISSQMACSNPEAIRKDLDAALTKAGLCKKEVDSISTQSIGVPAGVCPIAAALVVEVIGSQVPAAWGCTGGNAKAGLQAALTAACLAGVTSTTPSPAPATK